MLTSLALLLVGFLFGAFLASVGSALQHHHQHRGHTACRQCSASLGQLPGAR